LRAATRRHGTLLIIDETHTICAGPGGYTAAYGLEPDLLTIGKPIAGGVPVAAYGFSAEVAGRLEELLPRDERADVGGIGGTVAANVLSLAATRATLAEVLTDEAFERMIALGERFELGVADAIERHDLPWHVTRLGCRVEYLFRRERPRNGSEAAAGGDAEEEIRALMPGRVLEVAVEPGQAVEAGALLLVLEAMKMQNEIRAPRAGRVARVEARPGIAVDGGALLATLGPV